jgi:hypothetical protein
MTKRQKHQLVNRQFYNYIQTYFPQYEISFDEGGGRVYLLGENAPNHIEYHQSRHELNVLKDASPNTHLDFMEMEKYLNDKILAKINL